VSARVVRAERGLLVLAFRQEQAMLRSIDAALEQIGGNTRAAAA